MFKISLFVDKKHIETRDRLTIPRVGEFIVLDCGDIVKVVEVSHDWIMRETVQLNATPVEIKGGPGDE